MTEQTSTVETEETMEIAEYFEKETYSPYGLIKVVNKVLEDLGIDKVLPGPMGYTYCKKGYIATIDDAKKVVAAEDAIEWTEKYITKLTTKAVKVVETEAVEEDYSI
jgi:hypothetical protein